MFRLSSNEGPEAAPEACYRSSSPVFRLALLLPLVAACETSFDDEKDAGSDEDSGPVDECDTAGPLELGRCETSAGEECVGGAGEGARFVAMDGTMSLMVDAHENTVLVFMARTSDIDGGDPDAPPSPGHPLIVLRIVDEAEGDELDPYRGHVPFVDDPDVPGSQVTRDGFAALVSLEISFAREGHPLAVDGVLHDREGAVRCGTAAFTPQRDPGFGGGGG